MILEHRGVLTHIRPNITFKYITPLQPQIQRIACPPQPLIRSHPFPMVIRKQIISHVTPIEEEQKVRQKPWRRKKIFDRSYTCKSTFYSDRAREASLCSKQKLLQKQQVKKQRKAIFPKRNKNTAFTHYPFRNYSPPQSQVKHSSSLAQFRQQLHAHSETYAPSTHCVQPTSMELNNPSVIKVDLSESETERSMDHSEVFQLPNTTDQRFYDRETPTPQKREEKLSEVNLYATTINGNFLTKPEPQSPSALNDLLKSLKAQLRSNLLPFLLILFGFFILLVQASQ